MHKLSYALGEMLRDLRLAARSLRHNAGFALAWGASLGFGLAATAVTLAVVNAYLIRSMPFPAAERLYRVLYAPTGTPEPRGMSALDWKSLSDVVEVADDSAPTRLYMVGDAGVQEVRGLLAAAGSLEALRVQVVAGRSFAGPDFHPGAENVALIGHALWRERFGGDPLAIGRELRVSAASSSEPPQSFRIVGVLPPDFRYVREYARDPAEIVQPLRTRRTAYMVRLREGVPRSFAERRITEAAKRAATSVPGGWRGVELASIHTDYVRSLRPLLLAITIAVGLVLAIVAANLGVLTLLRSMRRQKEMAVRVALGAAPWHVARLLISESALLCAVALALGLSLAAVSLPWLGPLMEARLGRPVPGGVSALQIGPAVLLMIAGVTAVLTVALSLVPMLAPWKHRLAEALQREGRGGTDRPAARRARSLLVALEVAASMALLAGSGLMIRSVINLVRTDLGYRDTNVLRARIQLPPRGYPEAATFQRFYARLEERLSLFPETQFALSNFVPFFENPKQAIQSDGVETEGLRASVLLAGEGYFATLGVQVLQGRGFAGSDRAGSERVTVISDSLARRLWPKGSALGRRIRTLEPSATAPSPETWRTIVGVASDVRQTYSDVDLHDIYVPFAQEPSRFGSLLIRTEGTPAFWRDALRAAVVEIDPEALIQLAPSLMEEADQQIAGPRFLTSLLTGFAAFAVFLAMLGIYAVTAYAAQQRRREVAIRIAVGATRGSVLRLFLRGGGAVLAAGIALGWLSAAAVGRILESQIYGVGSFDGSTLAAAGALMGAAGVLATWWPVWRAATRNPMDILRAE